MKEKPPKAIFFDLDHTLVAYTESPETSWREICSLYSQHFKDPTQEKVLAAILEFADWYWSDPVRHKRGRLDLRNARREVVAGAFLALKFDNPVLAIMMADSFSARREGLITLFPGANETLAGLRSRGIRLGLITNGDSKGQRYKIDALGLAPFFDLIQIEAEAGIGKPEAGVYEMALTNLSVTPEEAWMIGDNLVWDIDGAQKARIKAIWVDYERQGLPAESKIRPDGIIHSLTELLQAGL